VKNGHVGRVPSAGNVTVITRNLRYGKIEKFRVIYAYLKFIFLQIIKNSKLTCVQSSATSVIGSTPNVQIMLIQGRPSHLSL